MASQNCPVLDVLYAFQNGQQSTHITGLIINPPVPAADLLRRSRADDVHWRLMRLESQPNLSILIVTAITVIMVITVIIVIEGLIYYDNYRRTDLLWQSSWSQFNAKIIKTSLSNSCSIQVLNQNLLPENKTVSRNIPACKIADRTFLDLQSGRAANSRKVSAWDMQGGRNIIVHRQAQALWQVSAHITNTLVAKQFITFCQNAIIPEFLQ